MSTHLTGKEMVLFNRSVTYDLWLPQSNISRVSRDRSSCSGRDTRTLVVCSSIGVLTPVYIEEIGDPSSLSSRADWLEDLVSFCEFWQILTCVRVPFSWSFGVDWQMLT